MGRMVVHFFSLPDLVDELAPGALVRLEKTRRAVPYESTPGFERQVYEVHARACYEGIILVWLVQVGGVEYLHGQPFGDPDAESRVEDLTVKVKDQIAKFLEDRDLEVRPGLIDLGNAKPVRGTWPGLVLLESDGGDHGPAE